MPVCCLKPNIPAIGGLSVQFGEVHYAGDIYYTVMGNCIYKALGGEAFYRSAPIAIPSDLAIRALNTVINGCATLIVARINTIGVDAFCSSSVFVTGSCSR